MTRNKIMAEAESHCTETGARFTTPRQSVLKIIVTSKKPVGAYDIINAMPDGTKPPTVYRALEFWEQEGFIHRISSLNLYTACAAGHRHAGAQFLICRDCGKIIETHMCDTPEICTNIAKANGFMMDGWFLELHGLCTRCAAPSGKAHGHHHAGHGCC